jgi:hypothetical protein
MPLVLKRGGGHKLFHGKDLRTRPGLSKKGTGTVAGDRADRQTVI